MCARTISIYLCTAYCKCFACVNLIHSSRPKDDLLNQPIRNEDFDELCLACLGRTIDFTLVRP